MLETATLDLDRRRRAHETIVRNALAMAQLIEDLLDVSRIVTGKMRLEVGAVDLRHVVDAALEAARPSLDGKRIRVSREDAANVSIVRGDGTRLQQIVWNLVSNAVKFTHAGGTIKVLIGTDDGNVELAVEDSGRGIAPGFLPHVFEAFRQADGTVARQTGGLGLGLAITKTLVELHGGTVDATSDGEGKGARFTLRLPVAIATDPVRPDAEVPIEMPHITPSPLPQLLGLRVLVVDDEEDARHLLGAVLEAAGCVVMTAGSAAAARQAFEAAKPDVLLSDIGMPGESGYDLIRWVRARTSAEGNATPAAALITRHYRARAEDPEEDPRRRVYDARPEADRSGGRRLDDRSPRGAAGLTPNHRGLRATPLASTPARMASKQLAPFVTPRRRFLATVDGGVNADGAVRNAAGFSLP